MEGRQKDIKNFKLLRFGLIKKEIKMLSCSCVYDDGEWWYYPPDDFIVFTRKRRKRCCSCNELINIGDQCVSFERARNTYSVIEERIWGDEVQLAYWYMCEWCGEMYFNLEALGYCICLGDSMKENLEDYWDITGFKPNQKEKGELK